MKYAKRTSVSPQSHQKNTAAINELREQIAALTDEVENLRRRLDGSERECSQLRGYQSTTQTIIGDLANNPFASLERLRHKARKALRRPVADA
jgi:DNA repair exonuclease SbcCD ATPase subunit